MMGLRAVLAIAERDIRSTLRDKMAMFWLVLFPIMMLTFSFLLWANPTKPVTLDVGVVYADSTMDDPELNLNFTARNVTDIMSEVEVETEEGEKIKVFNIREYEDEETAKEALRKGELDAVIVFPEGFSYNLSYGFSAEVKIYIRGGDAYREQITRAIIAGFFDSFSDKAAEVRIEASREYLEGMPPEEKEIVIEYFRGLAWPIRREEEVITPETLLGKAGLMGWFTVSAIGMQFLMAGLSIGATMVVEERERRTLRRLMASPIGPWDLLIGKTLSGLFSLAISALTCLLFGLALGARISWDPLNNLGHALVPLVLLLAAFTVLGLGLVISMVAKSARGASGMATAIGFPLMFLTGVWIPKWFLPEPLRTFADYFPVTMATDAIRAVMVFGRGAEAVLTVLPLLGLLAAMVYGLGVLAYKLVLRRSL